ncbi:hypothetical protein TB1_026834 [Malus domestica]
MKRFKQNLDVDDLSKHLDLDTRNALKDPDRKSMSGSIKVMGIFGDGHGIGWIETIKGLRILGNFLRASKSILITSANLAEPSATSAITI